MSFWTRTSKRPSEEARALCRGRSECTRRWVQAKGLVKAWAEVHCWTGPAHRGWQPDPRESKNCSPPVSLAGGRHLPPPAHRSCHQPGEGQRTAERFGLPTEQLTVLSETQEASPLPKGHNPAWRECEVGRPCAGSHPCCGSSDKACLFWGGSRNAPVLSRKELPL